MSKNPNTGSLLLILSTLAALVIANSSLASFYTSALHNTALIHLLNQSVYINLHHAINDGLMSLFFLMIGLELKRELVVGQLASVRRAMLPMIAAIGGMMFPALLYFYFNPAGITAAGWGIPMATDIAFAVGALTLLGNRIPKSLVVFLIALAIVDDLGAVLVIAVFYTKALNLLMLGVCAALIVALLVLNRRGTTHLLPYLLIGLLLWCAMLNSGVHATIAGVILAFCIPLPSVKKLEHQLHWPVTCLIVPVFAFANAGIPLSFTHIGSQLLNPVALGVISGLVLGKLIGISGATWLAVKLKIADLPAHLHMRHVIGIGLLGGIGFTMSIFIAELGFANYPNELLLAKTGILFASLLAGIAGISWLWFCDSIRSQR